MVKFTIPCHGGDDLLSRWFQTQLEMEANCDVKIVNFDGQSMDAHRNVLMAYSSTFKKVLNPSSQLNRQLIVLDFNMLLIRLVINLVYFGNVQIEEDEVGRFKTILAKVGVNGVETCDLNGELVNILYLVY